MTGQFIVKNLIRVAAGCTLIGSLTKNDDDSSATSQDGTSTGHPRVSPSYE